MKTQNIEIENTSFNSDIKNLSVAESFVDEVCNTSQISEDNYGNVLIAVTEAVNNAIFHGNRNDIEKQVHLSATIIDNELNITIKDNGVGFDYDNLPDPTAPENIEKETGRGIFLMRSLADKVEFEENGSKVILGFTLIK